MGVAVGNRDYKSGWQGRSSRLVGVLPWGPCVAGAPALGHSAALGTWQGTPTAEIQGGDFGDCGCEFALSMVPMDPSGGVTASKGSPTVPHPTENFLEAQPRARKHKGPPPLCAVQQRCHPGRTPKRARGVQRFSRYVKMYQERRRTLPKQRASRRVLTSYPSRHQLGAPLKP